MGHHGQSFLGQSQPPVSEAANTKLSGVLTAQRAPSRQAACRSILLQIKPHGHDEKGGATSTTVRRSIHTFVYVCLQSLIYNPPIMVRKTKQEALETRHRLLDAAEQLFHERGVSRTSLQDIATAAGVTRGAVYWHFEDKVELFTAMMDRATMPLEEGLLPREGADVPPTLADLRWGLLNVFHTCSHSERTRRVFEIAMKKVEFSGEMQVLHARKLANHRAWRSQNEACFQAAQKAGQLPTTMDTAAAAIALVALVDGLIHQWIMDPSAFDLMAMGEAAIEVFMNSLIQDGAPLLPPVSPEERARLGTQAICRPTDNGLNIATPDL